MIGVHQLSKRYRTTRGLDHWVLRDMSLVIPAHAHIGLIGRNGVGKSTLLRMIGGLESPTSGHVERACRVSWPLGFGGGLQGSLSGRQNAKFVCRLHGGPEGLPQQLAFVQDFAEIGHAFDEPVKTYSSGMRARLTFALSMAFDFDVYLSDEITSVGDAAFVKKASAAFRSLTDRAGLIMVSHAEATLREFCTSAIWLHQGQAHWFDSIDEALQAHKAHPV